MRKVKVLAGHFKGKTGEVVNFVDSMAVVAIEFSKEATELVLFPWCPTKLEKLPEEEKVEVIVEKGKKVAVK